MELKRVKTFITLFMKSNISATVYSVIPVMVYVFPLLVCPYAKILAGNRRKKKC